MLDPGPDFAKTPAQTIEVLRALDALHGARAAAAARRLAQGLRRRADGPRSAATGWPGRWRRSSHGVDAGAHMLRVHDVAATADFLAVRAALNGELEVDPALSVDDSLRWDQGPPDPAGFRTGGPLA